MELRLSQFEGGKKEEKRGKKEEKINLRDKKMQTDFKKILYSIFIWYYINAQSAIKSLAKK